MQIGVETARAVENKRIFVVSEDDITRAVLQFMLHDENETHELASLDAAYEKAVDWKPDLILVDLGIVERQGIERLSEIGARLPGAKIMLVAESGQDARAQPLLKLGAHSILAKPLTVEGVRRKVDAMLGRIPKGVVQLQLLPVAK